MCVCRVGFFLGSFWGKRVDRYGVGRLIYALMLREEVWVLWIMQMLTQVGCLRLVKEQSKVWRG